MIKVVRFLLSLRFKLVPADPWGGGTDLLIFYKWE